MTELHELVSCRPSDPCGQCGNCTSGGEPTGAALLDELRDKLARYVILPTDHAVTGVVLWIAATHAAPFVDTAPRLAIRSPQKRCGKTRLLDLIEATCNRALPTANTSAAVLYRVMGGEDPRTLLIDEADVIWGSKKTAEQNEDLRGLVNAGFERGRPTLRYDAKARKVEELETFGFVALAGIGSLPDTITDRAVNLVMRRRKPDETVRPYRRRRDREPLEALRDRLHAWMVSVGKQLEAAEPDALGVEDRAADVWEGLVAIADAAGGDWPRLARQAAVALNQEHDEEDQADSGAFQLLADVRTVFREAGVSFLSSKDLVFKLRELDDSPWGSADADLNTVRLAARLRPYKIAPKPDATGKVRGYRHEAFADAFGRYLGTDPSEPVKVSEPQVTTPDGSDGLTGQGVRRPDPSDGLTCEFDGLTGSDTSPACDCQDSPLRRANDWHRDGCPNRTREAS